MSRPESVRVLGQRLTIRTETNKDFTNTTNGHLQADEQYIRIADGIGPDKARETLLHEIVHAVSFAMCSDLNEHQVASMSNGLYAVLRDNPDLVSYLMDAVEW